MKKNTIWILLGLGAVGIYMYAKKKKGKVTVQEPEKITADQYAQAVQAADAQPMTNLVTAVQNITTKAKQKKEKKTVAKALVKAFGKRKTKSVGEISVIA